MKKENTKEINRVTCKSDWGVYFGLGDEVKTG